MCSPLQWRACLCDAALIDGDAKHSDRVADGLAAVLGLCESGLTGQGPSLMGCPNCGLTSHLALMGASGAGAQQRPGPRTFTPRSLGPLTTMGEWVAHQSHPIAARDTIAERARHTGKYGQGHIIQRSPRW